MPDCGANPSQQFARTERFGHIVVSSQLQEQDFVGNGSYSAEYNNRYSRGLLPDTRADVLPRMARQTQVENNGRRSNGSEVCECRFTVISDVYFVSPRFKKAFQCLLNNSIIVD